MEEYKAWVLYDYEAKEAVQLTVYETGAEATARNSAAAPQRQAADETGCKPAKGRERVRVSLHLWTRGALARRQALPTNENPPKSPL